jgi:hypothetical protein
LVLRNYIVILFCLALQSCQSGKVDIPQSELRDTLLSEYLQLKLSLNSIEDFDPQHSFLIAYQANDTKYLKEAVKSVGALIQTQFHDPCRRLNLLAIDALGYVEGYRFDYGGAFCSQTVNITVGIRNDSALLSAYLFTLDPIKDSCLTYERFDKPLSPGQWKSIQEALFQADIWGLKRTNGRNGLDGTFLSVTAYLKPVNAFEGGYNRIYRWAPERTSLGTAFKIVLGLSGIKGICFNN